MPAERYFYKGELSVGATIQIEGPELHHLLHVMRTQEGDTVEVVNGAGALATAVVEKIQKKYAELLINRVQTEAPPSFQIILAQAVPRNNRLDFILEKCTELGMTDIWLFPSKNSERKDFSANQMERMNTILIAAMKQCGSLFLPRIAIKPPLAKWDSLPLRGFYGDTEPGAPWLYQILAHNRPEKGVVFFIGPESGFAADEIDSLKKLNCQGVKLNERILRTDTAAIAAVALIATRFPL